MFIAFCLSSSTVYIFNDIIDIDSDRLHPTKRLRPIANGDISLKSSWCILIILYTFYLKKIQLIDATCIAWGFIFRILAGCFVISVTPSPLVVLMTFFLSLFFTFTKRTLEFKLNKYMKDCRKSLVGFTEESLKQLVHSNAILAIAFYLIYMLDKTTIARCGTDLLYISAIPFSLIIYRLLFLINSAQNDDPMSLFEKDKQIKFLILLYVLILAIILIV